MLPGSHGIPVTAVVSSHLIKIGQSRDFEHDFQDNQSTYNQTFVVCSKNVVYIKKLILLPINSDLNFLPNYFIMSPQSPENLNISTAPFYFNPLQLNTED